MKTVRQDGIDTVVSIGASRSVDNMYADPLTPGEIQDSDTSDGPTGLPAPGAFVGQYEIIGELGRGGMGAVFLARDTKLGRRVAVKFLYSNHPEFTARFILEARATARCDHENIVVIFEVGEHNAQPFMVLEYLEGTTLSRLVEDGRPLSSAQAVELMVPVARALARAHEHNIVHRDLKPDNIVVTDSGTVKVLDFGVAKLMHDSSELLSPLLRDELLNQSGDGQSDNSKELTRQGALVGTLPYMSPEQWGAGTVDHRSDIWAVGIILFRMIAGKHPLAPRRGRELMITGLLDEPMPSIRAACPRIPDELAYIIDRCLVKRKEDRMSSARELVEALETFLPQARGRRLRSDESPYTGLESFQESDAHRFFGRTQEVTAALTRLRHQPLLGVIGPSGVGKSSFVRAGLAPALKQSGESWSTVVVRPGQHPMASLAHAITPMVSGNGATTLAVTTVSDDLVEQRETLERLYREPGYLGFVLRSQARSHDQAILVFVDQFEELYTLVTDSSERLAFTSCLASIADDVTTPLRLVVALRSDFLDQVTEDPRFMVELTRSLFFLTTPNRDGLRDALIQPAEMAGYQFESTSMVEHMLDHLEHTPGALPLLQFAASLLWEMRERERRLLTDESYREIGGAAGALASHADAVLANLPSRDQGLTRSLLLRLVTPERTRAVVSIDELYELAHDPADVRRLIDQLVRARLLVVQNRADTSGASTVEIVHESLIHSWPTLRRWLEENQDDAAFLEQLRNAAKQWQAKGRPNGLLWRGQAMEEAKLWHRRYRGELPDLQRAYLQAVFAVSARAARRQRFAFISVIAFLSLVIAAAAIALVTIRRAEKEASLQADEATRQLTRAKAAEEEALRASTLAVEANKKLTSKNDELIAAVRVADIARHDAEAARLRAEESKQKARRDRRKARVKEGEARAAEGRAKAANERLQVLLEYERERRKQLEKQGVISVIPDVEVEIE